MASPKCSLTLRESWGRRGDVQKLWLSVQTVEGYCSYHSHCIVVVVVLVSEFSSAGSTHNATQRSMESEQFWAVERHADSIRCFEHDLIPVANDSQRVLIKN